ncbi:hypothetical protein, partial [Arthrobacter sp. DR-2P]
WRPDAGVLPPGLPSQPAVFLCTRSRRLGADPCRRGCPCTTCGGRHPCTRTYTA